MFIHMVRYSTLSTGKPGCDCAAGMVRSDTVGGKEGGVGGLRQFLFRLWLFEGG